MSLHLSVFLFGEGVCGGGGSHCPGGLKVGSSRRGEGSLSRWSPCTGGSLSMGVSVQGGLCQGENVRD